MEYIELYYAITECAKWEGSKIQKVFHNDDTFVFHLYKAGFGKTYFVLKIPEAICIVVDKPDLVMDALGAKLRKYWTNATLQNMSLVTGERIVKLVLSNKEGVNNVYIELFGKGNLVICNAEDKIILPWRSQSFTARTLSRGEQYELPPARDSVFEMQDNAFYALFGNEACSKVLAKIGLGKKYALEVCVRCEIDPLAVSVSSVEGKRLYECVQGLLGLEGEAAVVKYNAEPFHLVSVEGERESHGTFSGALYSTLKWMKPKTKFEKQLEKVENVILQQGKSVSKLQDRIVEETKKAELLYQHYEVVKEILGTPVDKLSFHPMVTKIDKKYKTLILDIE